MTLDFHLPGAASVAAIAMLTFVGCSSQTDVTPTQTAPGQYAEMNFDLEKCLPIQANLYKCPAIDKPLCTVEFSRPDVKSTRKRTAIMWPRGFSLRRIKLA